MAMAGGRSGEVGQGRGQVGQVGWVLTGFISFFGQEKNKMKLKGADLEHEQHEALVEHYQVETEPMNPMKTPTQLTQLLNTLEMLTNLNATNIENF